MPRGGYQRPKEPAASSGVGKNSKRTDGRQAIKSPNVQDSTDLTQGDRARIIQGQRVAPLSSTPTPNVTAPQGGGPMSQGMDTGMLPEHLFGMETSRPMEPITEGLPFGPGGGPEVMAQPDPTDEAEIVLQAMVQMTGDASISQMLDEHREFKAWRSNKANPVPTPQPSVTAPIMEADDADITPMEMDFPEEEEVAVEGEEVSSDASVETPEAATLEEEMPVV